MPITKEKKKEILADVKEKISSSKNVSFVNFHGLSVSELTEMRQALRQNSVGYMVAKKTLVRRALDEASLEGEMPELDGELAIAYGEDIIAPAREVYSFQKKFDGRINIVGGVFDGVYKSKEEMVEIAAIPPMQTLRGMFVNVINSPIQGLVVGLSKSAEKKTV